MKSTVSSKHEQQNSDRPMIEKFGLEPIPKEMKNTRWYEYAIIQFSYAPNAGNFLVPALAVTLGGLSFGWALLCTVIGATFSFYLSSVMSLPGSKYGIPAQYAFRSFLGIKGAKYISSPIRAIVLIYWFAVQTIGGAIFIQVLLQRLGGITIPLLPISLLAATFVSVLAMVGFEAVRKITKYCLPVLITGGVISLILFVDSPLESFQFARVWESPKATNDPLSMIFFASLAFVNFLAVSWSTADLARYAKTDHDSYWGLLIGNILGVAFTALLAIYAASATGELNPYVVANEIANSQLIALIIFLTAMVSMILINMNNAYSGGFSLLNCFPSLGRVKSTFIFCLAGILLSCFPIVVNKAEQYISLLGSLVAPVVGVIFIEYVFIRKRTIDLSILQGKYYYNFPAIVMIVFGTILALLLPANWPSGIFTFGVVSIIYVMWYKFSVKSFTGI